MPDTLDISPTLNNNEIPCRSEVGVVVESTKEATRLAVDSIYCRIGKCTMYNIDCLERIGCVSHREL